MSQITEEGIRIRSKISSFISRCILRANDPRGHVVMGREKKLCLQR